MFKEFHQATSDLEGNKDPNIHLVLPVIGKLKKHCAPVESDSDPLTVLRSSCLEYLEVSDLLGTFKFGNPAFCHKCIGLAYFL